MKFHQFILPPLAITGLLILAFGNTPQSMAQDKSVKDEKSFPQKFWNYLTEDAGYKKNYTTWPHEKDEFVPGEGPHGAHLKVYVNETLKKNSENPPHKSIIVKENYTEDKKLAAITVMYRTKGYDSKNKDWYWVKYLPNGKVAKMNDTKLAGKVEGCIQCHKSAKGNDYVFTNDQKE